MKFSDPGRPILSPAVLKCTLNITDCISAGHTCWSWRSAYNRHFARRAVSATTRLSMNLVVRRQY